ncbi:hypothetical protein ACFL6N_03775 [Thermodesulfobacteriota bacterium]
MKYTGENRSGSVEKNLGDLRKDIDRVVACQRSNKFDGVVTIEQQDGSAIVSLNPTAYPG